MATPLAGVDQRATKQAPAAVRVALGSYCAELPLDLLDAEGNLLDWVIGFAFDTLQARHLDLRIVAGTRSPALITHRGRHS